MELRLDKCIVRGWRDGDKSSLVRHANNWSVSRNLRDRFPYPYTVRDADEWLAWLQEREPQTHFAIEVERSAVGGIGFELQGDIFRRSAEIGFWVGEQHWGRGIATEALRAVTAYAFEHFDVCRLYASVFETNAASARVLEKAGYALEGRLRRSVSKAGWTLDSLLYACVREVG